MVIFEEVGVSARLYVFIYVAPGNAPLERIIPEGMRIAV